MTTARVGLRADASTDTMQRLNSGTRNGASDTVILLALVRSFNWLNTSPLLSAQARTTFGSVGAVVSEQAGVVAQKAA